jgi:MFS transporter, PAT family, solute carrier family 33 (acetyl-CoA transportor), member 1
MAGLESQQQSVITSFAHTPFIAGSTPHTVQPTVTSDSTNDTLPASSSSTYSPVRLSRTSIQLDINPSTAETQPLFDPQDDDSLLSDSDSEAVLQNDPLHTNQMSTSSRIKKQKPIASNGHSATPHQNGHTNGHATGADSLDMLEHRRKGGRTTPSSENAREAVREHLMSRSSFSLNDPVPEPLGFVDSDGSSPRSSAARGFTELPKKDQRNFLLLVLLYFLQGLPMGLALGSVPLLLKQHVSYTQMGVFSLAGYPYSLKLLWSPIVDAMWSPKFGRRKSWIVPIQALSGIGMLWLAGMVEDLINHAGDNGGANVWGFTMWWFSLVFMCATQDIAVDGTSLF